MPPSASSELDHFPPSRTPPKSLQTVVARPHCCKKHGPSTLVSASGPGGQRIRGAASRPPEDQAFERPTGGRHPDPGTPDSPVRCRLRPKQPSVFRGESVVQSPYSPCHLSRLHPQIGGRNLRVSVFSVQELERSLFPATPPIPQWSCRA